MKKKLFGVAAAAALIAPLLIAPPADARPDCDGQYRTQVSSRSQDEYFHEPITGNKVPYRVTGLVGYIYCPNGNSAWKMRVKWIEWCWLQHGEEDNHRIFDGVTFNPRIGDDQGIRINPPSFKVDDDGTRQNCRRQNILAENEEWQWGFSEPKWAASFTLNLENPINDHNHYFGEGSSPGTEWRMFLPGHDTPLTDWEN